MKKLAVILCGGLGTRLRPYTLTIPKPLLPIGNVSILEIVIRQLKKNGFSEIVLALNYHADMIRNFFQGGEKFGVSITYCEEEKPLGTIGPLTLIKDLPEKFLLLNGDILTDLDFAALFHRHDPSQHLLTVPLSLRNHCVDFGVFELDDQMNLRGFREKPRYSFAVSMGAYAISAQILPLIPKGQLFGFDHLMERVIDEQHPIACYHHKGFWLDIGRHEDYAKAQDEWPQLESILLPTT
jgi:NDP-sugar pyrophosphorylase family protein